MRFLIITIALVGIFTCGGKAQFRQREGPYWNALTTTFAPDGFISWIPGLPHKGYSPIPRTQSEASKEEWMKISDNCENDGKFNGLRYVGKQNGGSYDYGVTALYDKNGFIAGLQMNVLVSAVESDPTNTYKYADNPIYVRNWMNNQDYYTLTAYFVDPSTICTTGRDSSDFDTEGTGNQLAFQNGTGISNLIIAPQQRKDALATGWSNNQCFIGMGVHNWYKQEEFQLTNCDSLLPVFLLYAKNSQKLLGFGFMAMGRYSSPRFEQPPAAVISLIVGRSASPCIAEKINTVGLTTMHVYMISNPYAQTCIF